MAKYQHWSIYGRDERGAFTVDTGTTYQRSYFDAEEAARLNREPSIEVYEGQGYVVLATTDFQWGKWRNPEWRAREAKRLADGTYSPLPWSLEPIADHFAHISIDKGSMVAFTPDEAKGMVDVQVRMKPGRYLTKFYPNLTGDEVRTLACELDAANAVRFAETADDMETVYTNGPSSCMSHDAYDYSSPIHPVRVYAAGDLAVAFLSSVAIGEDGFRASARALCWPDKKLYGRIYGDSDRLAPALAALGYEEGDLDGAKVRKMAHGNGYVLPYIDGCQSVTDHGSHFVIGGGEIDANETNGLSAEAEPEGEYCEYYEEHRDEETYSVQVSACDWQTWCETAVENHAVRMYGGGRWSDEYFRKAGAECGRTGRNVELDETVHLEDTEETVCADWARDHAYCNDDGEWFAEKPEDEADEDEADTPAPYHCTDPAQLALPIG
jgi:hypothetical protein